MKNLISFLLFVSALTSFSAIAAETYECSGTNDYTLTFKSSKNVKVETDDGSEYDLDFAQKNSKNTLFGDYDYDGYGGYVELKLPKNLKTSGSNAMEEFKASLIVKTYSEIGHVGTEVYKADCQRADN